MSYYDAWILLLLDEWKMLESEGSVRCQQNEYVGEWHDDWIRKQMGKRTTGYEGHHPHWLFFDPLFDSLMGKLITNDFLVWRKEAIYVVNVRIPRDRCILLPESIWLAIHGNSYIGETLVKVNAIR